MMDTQKDLSKVIGLYKEALIKYKDSKDSYTFFLERLNENLVTHAGRIVEIVLPMSVIA